MAYIYDAMGNKEKESSVKDQDNSQNGSPANEQGQLTSSQELRDVFHASFPQLQDEIVHAFGYGSGVFVQTDQNEDEEKSKAKKSNQEKKMLDMVLIVKDAFKFHSLNIQCNPNHYALVFRDPSRATWWQNHDLSNGLAKNPKVFFNFVEDPFLKYGVMEEANLCSDLENWDSLYIGGRMHKPTATIFQQLGNGRVEMNQANRNLPAALSMALLLSAKESMTLSELYSQISALSYTGDFRMQLGAEDPGKINKLVQSPGQLCRFNRLYQDTALRPLLQSGIASLDGDTLSWNPNDASAVSAVGSRLPQRLQDRMDSSANLEMTIYALRHELHSIVAPAARYQSFKGLWTAGLTKSARYAFAKLSKGVLKRFR